MKSAKILEVYAVHSRDETVTEYEEFKERIDKIMD